jgi:TetR/AcrR family transcriptional repressor of bet genes
MARKSLAEIRRAELADAAYKALSEHGLKGTTLATVAQISGISRTSALHYFSSKDALLEAAMRTANGVLRKEAVTLMRIAQTPWERIYAVIEANLSPTSFNPQVSHAWVALCSEVPRNATYQRIQNAIYRRHWVNIHSAFAQIESGEQAQDATMMLITLIDGLWLRCGLQPGGLAREAAEAQIEFSLKAAFGDKPERLAARDRMKAAVAILVS